MLVAMKKVILYSMIMSGAVLFSSCNKNSNDSGSGEKAEAVLPTGELAKLFSESAVVLDGCLLYTSPSPRD